MARRCTAVCVGRAAMSHESLAPLLRQAKKAVVCDTRCAPYRSPSDIPHHGGVEHKLTAASHRSARTHARLNISDRRGELAVPHLATRLLCQSPLWTLLWRHRRPIRHSGDTPSGSMRPSRLSVYSSSPRTRVVSWVPCVTAQLRSRSESTPDAPDVPDAVSDHADWRAWPWRTAD